MRKMAECAKRRVFEVVDCQMEDVFIRMLEVRVV